MFKEAKNLRHCNEFHGSKNCNWGKKYLNSSALNQKVCGTAFTPMEFDPQLKIPSPLLVLNSTC